MNWATLSEIAEISSSGAVLVTLIYLAIQTRQNAEAIQANTRQAILASDQRFLMQIADNPELELLHDKPELTDDEKIRLSAMSITFYRMRENDWFQFKHGVLDKATWTAYRAAILAYLGSGNTWTWWHTIRPRNIFDSRFVSMVDQLLEDAPQLGRSIFITAFD